MNTLLLIVFFIFGTIMGSFLNVLILRFKTGRGIGGRSSCNACNKVLTWKELVPVFSFLFQKGRCKNCKVKLSIQYPIVEVLGGLLSTLVMLACYKYLVTDIAYFIVWYVSMYSIWMCLLAICVYDIKHKIIPDEMLVFCFFVILFLILYSHFLNLSFLLNSLLNGFFLALPFGLLFFISKGRWVGFGDAKLLFICGFLLGLMGGIVALLIGVYVSTIFSLILVILLRKKYTMKSEIPFGPFIVLGMSLVYFSTITPWDITLLFTSFFFHF